MLKSLFIWKDPKGNIYQRTATVTTDQNRAESYKSSAKEQATYKLFEHFTYGRFPNPGAYFLDQFHRMASENGWKFEEIEINHGERNDDV